MVLDSCTAWEPGGAAIDAADRAALAGWLRQEPRIDLVQTAAAIDPWRLARDVRGWRSLLVGRVKSSQLIFEVAAGRKEPPERTLFWLLEVPALRHRGGGNNRPPRFTYGPIDLQGTRKVRDWLFADPLPVAPNVDGGVDQQPESRVLLWSWAVGRAHGVAPPGEGATRVLGVVVEQGDQHGGAALAAFADGRVRYVNGHSVVVSEPDVSPELAPHVAALLAGAQALVVGPATGRDESSLPPRGVRVTALTCGGAYATRAPDPTLVEAARALLVSLIHVVGTD